MDSGETSPAVFLSYARRQPDEDWAARVVEILRRRYDVRVLFDKRDLALGHRFEKEIEAAIRSADALVFLGSSSSVTSVPCRDECIYAREQGKPLIPLFIEDTSWGAFPADFHPLQYEQLYRAGDDEQLAAIIGKGLLDAGLGIDRARVPERTADFDVWAPHVYPPYRKIRQADARTLRKYVDECSHKLKLRIENGYHNLNLALLFLRLGEHRRAADYSEIALRDLPGRPDAHYYEALITAAAEPLSTMRRSRAGRVVQSLETAIQLTHETATKSQPAISAMAWLLKAVIAHDYYLRNGLISRAGEPKALLSEAHRRACDTEEVDRVLKEEAYRGLTEEVDRLLDSLSGLSARTLDAISSFKKDLQEGRCDNT